jgi:SAM-dependent methyltransferase
VIGRRARVLATHLATLMPPNARVLDVGCGDGLIGSLIEKSRTDVRIRGIDSLVRPATRIPVEAFDGLHIPFDAAAFDLVIVIDVLHHAEAPQLLLRETARVAKRAVLIKDVMEAGWLARPTLRFMDRVGNERHGVTVPESYWSAEEWHSAFTSAGLRADLSQYRLGLYPPPFSWLFERSFHFVSRLVHQGAAGGEPG